MVAFLTTSCTSEPSPASEADASNDILSSTDITGTDESAATPSSDVVEATENKILYTDESLALTGNVLAEGAFSWVQSAGSTVLAGQDQEWIRIDGKATSSLSIPEGIETLDVIDLAHIDDQTILVLTELGLYAIQGSEVVESPLNSLFTGLELRDMEVLKTGQGSVVYFGTDQGVLRWSQGELQDLDLGELSTSNARLTSHGMTLWVASGTDLYQIQEDGGELQAWPESGEYAATKLGADATGRLWLQTDKGVQVRHLDGSWEDLTVEKAMDSFIQSTASDTMWLWSQASLWQVQDNVARRVDEVPEATTWAMDASGALLAATPKGLLRYSGGRQITVEGWQEEGILLTATELTLAIEDEAKVETVLVAVNGQSIDVDETHRFTLEPASLGPGPHVLTVSVTYSDTELQAVLTLDFDVIFLSWQTNIFPIHKAHCGGCHGETGNVALKLYTAAQWEEAFDMVLPSVETGFMPPPYILDNPDLDTIRRWALAGFPP